MRLTRTDIHKLESLAHKASQQRDAVLAARRAEWLITKQRNATIRDAAKQDLETLQRTGKYANQAK